MIVAGLRFDTSGRAAPAPAGRRPRAAPAASPSATSPASEARRQARESGRFAEASGHLPLVGATHHSQLQAALGPGRVELVIEHVHGVELALAGRGQTGRLARCRLPPPVSRPPRHGPGGRPVLAVPPRAASAARRGAGPAPRPGAGSQVPRRWPAGRRAGAVARPRGLPGSDRPRGAGCSVPAAALRGPRAGRRRTRAGAPPCARWRPPRAAPAGRESCGRPRRRSPAWLAARGRRGWPGPPPACRCRRRLGRPTPARGRRRCRSRDHRKVQVPVCARHLAPYALAVSAHHAGLVSAQVVRVGEHDSVADHHARTAAPAASQAHHRGAAPALRSARSPHPSP